MPDPRVTIRLDGTYTVHSVAEATSGHGRTRQAAVRDLLGALVAGGRSPAAREIAAVLKGRGYEAEP